MITIINLASIILGLGLLLLLGPTLISWIFSFFTWFEPLSAFTTMFLMLEVIANIVLAIRYKNNTVLIDNDYESVDVQMRKQKQNKRWLRIAQVSGLASVALVFANELMIQLNNSWRWFIVGNKDSLAITRYIGGILFTAGLFFFIGKIYQAKSSKTSEEYQEPTPQSWEGYTAPPVQVIRRPDDAQIASWQQPMQQMPIVPMYQQPVQPAVQYEPQPIVQWQQGNMWYSDETPMVGYGSTRGSWEMGPIVRPPYSEPQPIRSTARYEKECTYGRGGKLVNFPYHKKMLSESDLTIHLPKSAWKKLFGRKNLKFS